MMYEDRAIVSRLPYNFKHSGTYSKSTIKQFFFTFLLN